MTMQASVQGRVGRGPDLRQTCATKSRKKMGVTSIAVNLAPGEAEEPEPLRIKALASERQAETLAVRCAKREAITVAGKFTEDRWVRSEGTGGPR